MTDLSIPAHLRSHMEEDAFQRNRRGAMIERLKTLAEAPDLFSSDRHAIEWAIEQIEDLRNDNLALAAELDEAYEDLEMIREGGGA